MYKMWNLQKSLSRSSYRRLRTERWKNRHLHVYAVPALRGNVPVRGMLESEDGKQNGFQISELVGTIDK